MSFKLLGFAYGAFEFVGFFICVLIVAVVALLLRGAWQFFPEKTTREKGQCRLDIHL